MSSLALNWIAEYHGPNPYSVSPVVVADLRSIGAPVLPDQALLALRLASSAARRPLDSGQVLALLEQIGAACRRHHPDYQARILMAGARKLGVPFQSFLSGSRYMQFGWGANSQLFFESASNADGLVAEGLQRDKEMAKRVMVALGMPTPPHLRVASEDELEPALRRLVAAIRREPAAIAGDGRQTVAELLAGLNRGRSRNLVKSRYLRSPDEVGGGFIELNSTPGLDACVAAGWTEESIACLVLGDGLGRIPVELHLVADEALASSLAALRLAPLGADEGWVCGTQARIGAAVLHADSTPWAGVRLALRNRRLRRLRVICTVADLVRNGLPVDRFSRVEAGDVRLPAQWLRVLERCAPGWRGH